MGFDFPGANLEGQHTSVIFVNPAIIIPANLALGPIAIVGKNGSGDYCIRA
jgi:hypothetical protein